MMKKSAKISRKSVQHLAIPVLDCRD